MGRNQPVGARPVGRRPAIQRRAREPARGWRPWTYRHCFQFLRAPGEGTEGALWGRRTLIRERIGFRSQGAGKVDSGVWGERRPKIAALLRPGKALRQTAVQTGLVLSAGHPGSCRADVSSGRVVGRTGGAVEARMNGLKRAISFAR